MKIKRITFLLCLVFVSWCSMGVNSCVYTGNSSAGDDTLYNQIDETSAYGKVAAIIKANCNGSGCHSGWVGLPEATLLAKNDPKLITPGNAVTSLLYDRLNGVTTGTGTKNMPMGGALSAQEISDIASWINALPATSLETPAADEEIEEEPSDESTFLEGETDESMAAPASIE